MLGLSGLVIIAIGVGSASTPLAERLGEDVDPDELGDPLLRRGDPAVAGGPTMASRAQEAPPLAPRPAPAIAGAAGLTAPAGASSTATKAADVAAPCAATQTSRMPAAWAAVTTVVDEHAQMERKTAARRVTACSTGITRAPARPPSIGAAISAALEVRERRRALRAIERALGLGARAAFAASRQPGSATLGVSPRRSASTASKPRARTSSRARGPCLGEVLIERLGALERRRPLLLNITRSARRQRVGTTAEATFGGRRSNSAPISRSSPPRGRRGADDVGGPGCRRGLGGQAPPGPQPLERPRSVSSGGGAMKLGRVGSGGEARLSAAAPRLGRAGVGASATRRPGCSPAGNAGNRDRS